MNKRYFKRISTWIGILTIILIVIFICIYIFSAEIIIKIPIGVKFTPEILGSIIIGLLTLAFTSYKWFRRGEIISEYNEMNRMKSHLFNNMKHEDFKKIINLSYNEIYSEYEKLESQKTMQIIGDKVEKLRTPTRRN